jgi:predicted lipoprotein with Yx(FWY)xxD motif
MQLPITLIRKRARLPLVAIPAAGFAIVAAACGGAGAAYGGSSSGGKPYGTVPASTGALSVKVATSSLGSVLTDGKGRTLYLFTRDSGAMSSCSGGCASVWPPVTSATAAHVGTGATASLLGTTSGAGATQVTYDGHPLYYYVGDTNPGDANGEQLDQFGGLWYAVSPGGMQVTK